MARPQEHDRRERRKSGCSPAAASSAARSRRRWWPTSSGCTGSTGWKETPPPGVVFRTRTVPDGLLAPGPPTTATGRWTSGKWRLLTAPRATAPERVPRRAQAPKAPAPEGSALGKTPVKVIGED